MDINNIKTFMDNALDTGTIVAIGTGGSIQMGVTDKASDTDLVFLVTNRQPNDISTQFQFFDTTTNKITDCLIRDIDTLTKLSSQWLYGWGSWAWYLTSLWYTNKQDLVIYDNRVQQVLETAYNNRDLFIFGLLSGYSEPASLVLQSETMPNLIGLHAKSIYHLCYVYNQEIEQIFSNELLIKIKRNRYTEINKAEFKKIINALNNLNNKYNNLSAFSSLKRWKDLNSEIVSIWR